MKFDTNTILTIIASLIVAAGAYWYFFTGSGNAAPLSIVSTSSATQTRFQTLVTELQQISFDTGIFSDARFTALVDISTAITPESSGRLDPFAPVSSAGGTKKP